MERTKIHNLPLNAQQAAAVFSNQPKVLVLAGAGTGKTRVLTARVCHLLETGTSPRQIQAFTFTNKAAQELRKRLQELIPKKANRRITAGTFHSFAYRVIDEWAAKINYRPGVSVLDQQDRRDVIGNICDDLFGARHKAVFKMVMAGEPGAEVADVMDEYAYRVRSYNCVDFDLLQQCAVELLEQNPEALRAVQARARHILVDEFQDTDPMQARLIELLDPETLFVVGDVDQSIFGFRGADMEILLNFKERHPEAYQVILPANYRSTSQIVGAANALIGHNKKRIEKELIAANGRAGLAPDLILADDVVYEARAIAALVGSLTREGGLELKDIAILARTNLHIDRIVNHGLRPAKIPTQAVTEERNVWETQTARGFIHFMKALVNPRDYQAKAQVLNWPFVRVDRKTMVYLRRHMATHDLDLFGAAREAAADVPGVMPFLRAFWEIEELNRREAPDAYRMALLIDKRLGVQELYNQRGLRGRLRDLENFLHRVRIWVNERKADEPTDAKAFVTYSVSLSLQDSIRDEAQAVKAMTVHAAKGLEFPAVIVAGCVEGLFPHVRSLKEGQLEEERRLFYVACTRAMDRLHLTAFRRRSGQEFKPWEKPGEVERSRFVAEALGARQPPSNDNGWRHLTSIVVN